VLQTAFIVGIVDPASMNEGQHQGSTLAFDKVDFQVACDMRNVRAAPVLHFSSQ
jgi:hypothetical protein